MTQTIFDEIVKRNGLDRVRTCYELHAESFKPVDINYFTQQFKTWCLMTNKNTDSCIAYFKQHKVK